MEKLIHNDVVDALLQRRSHRSYREEALSAEEINTIVQCALWAPSAINQQTTQIAVIDNKAWIEELAQDAGREGFHYGAPCFLLFYALKDNRWSAANAALATENATLAAHALGLGSVIIGCTADYLLSEEGAEKWQTRLGVSENYEFVLGLLVGHSVDAPQPKPRNQENIKWK